MRYFEKLVIPPEHLNTRVDHIDVIAPGSFGIEDKWSQRNRTIYLRCESHDLLALEHKPHFPASFFHVTLYDGYSLDFARSLLDVFNRFVWRFRVPLPPNTTLSKIEIRPRNTRKKKARRQPYRSELKSLFQAITTQKLTRHLIDSLSDGQREEIAAAICSHLHIAVANFQEVAPGDPLLFPEANKSASFEDNGEVHITPPELAQAVAQYAVYLLQPSSAEVHFGDPAVGNGAFFSALLKVLPRERITSAIGIDISAQQIAVAHSRWSHHGLEVKLGDYLHMGRLPPRTLILANPPYRRHQQIPAKDKLALRERASMELGMRVSGRAGLYVYFLLLAHEWMAPDAVAAWLVPSEFMQTDYGAAVRYYLTHRVQLIRVHRFDHREPQFENAEVLPAVIVFRNREPHGEDEALISVGGTLSSPGHCEPTLVRDLRLEAKWSVPTAEAPVRLLDEVKIGDLFTVRRGIATGANDFFIIKKDSVERLGIPSLAVRPILPKARTLISDIIERADDGFPALTPKLCLIDCSLSLAEIKNHYPRFSDYLAHANSDLLGRNLVRRRKPWYRQEQREPARFLCTYMGRGREGLPPIRFIWNKSDAIATNTYLMLYPRPALARLLLTSPSLEEELFELLKQAALQTMQGSWRIHAGGLIKIEPGELLQVPLPKVPTWIRRAVELRL